MANIIAVLRFTLILPVAALSWFATFMAGIFTEISIKRHFCPGAYQRGMKLECTISYADEISSSLFLLFVALSAVVVVGSAVLIAPTHKLRCGIAIYCVGALFATLLAIEFGPSTWLSAIIAGLLPLVALKRREHKEHSA